MRDKCVSHIDAGKQTVYGVIVRLAITRLPLALTVTRAISLVVVALGICSLGQTQQPAASAPVRDSGSAPVPLSTREAGHHGYKRFLLGTTAMFAAMSAGVGLSPTLKSMLIWRALERMAGAGLVGLWPAAIYILMPQPRRRDFFLGVSIGLFLACSMGLLLSDFLTDRLNWRLICVPNLFLVTAAVWLLKRNFPDLPMPERTAERCYLSLQFATSQ